MRIIPIGDFYSESINVRKHEVNDESENVDFNASPKAINEKWGTTASMTIFS